MEVINNHIQQNKDDSLSLIDINVNTQSKGSGLGSFIFCMVLVIIGFILFKRFKYCRHHNEGQCGINGSSSIPQSIRG